MGRLLPFGYSSTRARAVVSYWSDNELVDIPVDGAGWQSWLATGQAFRMTVATDAGVTVAFNVRPEIRKNSKSLYWKCWKSIAGQTKNFYLGPSSRVTRDKLNEAGVHFANLMPRPEEPGPMDWDKLTGDQQRLVERYIQTLLANN